MLRRICVFAGSSPGANPAYAEAARALGRELAGRGLGVVYGGGNVGLMGELADSAMAAGGEVIGVIPEGLLSREVGHRGLTELRVVDTMHQRKALMYQLSDAVIAMPGGIGTFDELFESLTWNQLGIHCIPCGALNVAGYYDPLAAMMQRAGEKGFLVDPENMLAIASDVDVDAGGLQVLDLNDVGTIADFVMAQTGLNT